MATFIDRPFSNFTNNLNDTQFIKEITNALSGLAIDYASDSGLKTDKGTDNVRITFITVPSPAQIITYDALVSAHVPIPDQLNYTHIHVGDNTTELLPTTSIIDAMTATPQAGTYMITFSASMSSTVSTDIIRYGIYKNAFLVPSSYRRTSGLVSSVNTTTIETVNGSDVITIQWTRESGSGDRTCESRTLILLKV